MIHFLNPNDSRRLIRRGGILALVLGIALAGGNLLLAQSASPAPAKPLAPNGLDFSGLSAEQTTTATQILGDTRCNCGCGMTLLECRAKDPNCSRSLSLARALVDDLKAGKDAATARTNLQTALAKAAAAAPPPPPPPDPNKVYTIDIKVSPFRGPKSAPVVLVEFSDYQ
jgi:protein-disulfide isomerase